MKGMVIKKKKKEWTLDIKRLLIYVMEKNLGMSKMYVLTFKLEVLPQLLYHGTSKPFSMFAGNSEIVIEWNKIKCIGENVILVEI